MINPADPKSNYMAHRHEIDEAIGRVVNSGWYILGEEVSAFEKEFAQFVGIGSAVGTASGTDALQLALRSCGVGRDDVVITVSHTAVAIELCGATPLLIDVDAKTFTMDPNHLEETLKESTSGLLSSGEGRVRAVLPVHLYGHPADMVAITSLAERYGLHVIEDCAQSHGAALAGRKTGAWGHVAAFSFYPTKNLGALGDAGAVTTDNPELAQHARLLREYGWKERYISHFTGMNTRLDELQAAILRVKLRHLDGENVRRQQIARLYDNSLLHVDLILPQSRADVSHVYHQYVVRSEERDDLRSFLKADSIGTLIHYPLPVHLQPAYQDRVPVGPGGLTNTESVCREILSLPIHPQMSDEQAQMVCDAIIRWSKSRPGTT